MKLINSTFDSRVLNERIYGKFGRVRIARRGYYWDPEREIDFDASAEELERTIGDAYREERMYQPNKQNMRVRWNRKKKATVEWWDERPGGAGRDNWGIINARLDGHVKKYVGRKFDDCFSDLKRKFFENKDWRMQAGGFGTANHKSTRVLWMAMQDRFLDMFEPNRWGSDFSVGDDGLIYDTSEPRKHRSRDIVLYDVGECYYQTIPPNLEHCRSLFENLPSNVYKQAMIEGRLDVNTIQRLRGEIENSARIAYHGNAGYNNVEWHKMMWSYLPGQFQVCSRYYYNGMDVINYCFKFIDNREKVVLKAGSREWKRYKRDHIKPGTRTNPVDRANYYDRSLWVSNYIKSHNGNGNFHELMSHTPDEIRYKEFITALETILDNPGYYAGAWGATKQELKNAVAEFADSDWYKKHWITGSPMSQNFMVAEIVNIIKTNKQ